MDRPAAPGETHAVPLSDSDDNVEGPLFNSRTHLLKMRRLSRQQTKALNAQSWDEVGGAERSSIESSMRLAKMDPELSHGRDRVSKALEEPFHHEDLGAETITFRHQALENAASQIRLLRLLPSDEDEQDTRLKYAMTAHNVNDSPKYRAISYVWGDSSLLNRITIDDETFVVRRNCYYALWQISLHFPDSYVWVDSVCIDQENTAEKSAQVQMMGTIFKEAQSVAASLGPHSDGSDKIFSWDPSTHPWRTMGATLVEPLKAFIERPIWSRLWIVQELNLAASLSLVCGPDSILNWKTSYLYYYLPDYVPCRDTPYHTLMHDTFLARKSTMFEAMMRYQHFKCEDSKDHLYGLLSLCNGETAVVGVDYSISSLELAMQISSTRRKSKSSYAERINILDILEVESALSFLECKAKIDALHPVSTAGIESAVEVVAIKEAANVSPWSLPRIPDEVGDLLSDWDICVRVLREGLQLTYNRYGVLSFDLERRKHRIEIGALVANSCHTLLHRNQFIGFMSGAIQHGDVALDISYMPLDRFGHDGLCLLVVVRFSAEAKIWRISGFGGVMLAPYRKDPVSSVYSSLEAEARLMPGRCVLALHRNESFALGAYVRSMGNISTRPPGPVPNSLVSFACAMPHLERDETE